MLRRAKHTLTNKITFNLKIIKWSISPINLVLFILCIMLFVKFLFTSSCSLNLGFFSGSTKPMSIETNHAKIGTTDGKPETRK